MELTAQPAQSPDLNVDNLGFFASPKNKATKGSAATSVQGYERNCNPSWREASLELELIYGAREIDELPMQVLDIEGNWIYIYIHRHFAEESSNYTVELDAIWAQFETLDEIKPQAMRKAALFLGVRDVLSIFAQLATRPEMGYEDLKRIVIASYTYFEIGVGQAQGTVAFQTTASNLGSGRKPEAYQCASCLEKNQRWKECRRYLSGKPPVERPPSTERSIGLPRLRREAAMNKRMDRHLQRSQLWQRDHMTVRSFQLPTAREKFIR